MARIGRLGALALLLAALGFLILDLAFPFPADRLAPSPSVEVRDRHGEPVRLFLAPDHAWRFPVTLEELAPDYLAAVLASEDRHFYRHPGVNPLSLAKALAANVAAGRVVRGGSTITMQVARLAEPKRRTVWAKLVECFRALQLELHWSKREILGFYVNLAPFGGNLVGVGAGSRFLFGKAPGLVSLGEAALLAGIPRSPNAYNPVKHPEAARRVRESVLKTMVRQGAARPEQAALAVTAPVPARVARPPLVGPHLAQMALARMGRAARIDTTLDSRTQELTRQALRTRLAELRAQGVENAAVVVIDVATRGVLALAGSADYLDAARHGALNAATARRSPGSALKPFLYALAFQEGLAAPQTLLLDLPVAVGGYEPKNYDGQYRGRVEAAEALIHSYNAPAVRLLAETGVPAFLDLLRRGGLAGLSRPPDHYGLSLVLGGGEVSLLELTNLYATLARGGLHGPAAITVGGRTRPEERLLSAEACALTAEILARLERPDLPGGVERARGVPVVAWKTGTSFGHRDAWAVGFSARHAVGVWAGNVEGRPVKGISGARQAAPLLFDVFRALEPGGSSLPRPEGLNLEQAEVCAVSRGLPGPDCGQTVKMDVIPGATRLAPCQAHRRVLVDAATGLRVAGSCLEGRAVRAEVVVDYPPDLAAWWAASGMELPDGPRPDPACAEAVAGQGPRIVSPREGMVYRLRPDAPGAFQRVGLAAVAGADAGGLSWFQDGRLVAGQVQGEPLFLELVPGAHRLVVVDARGRSDGVRYTVEP
ncbi:Penicillin-binding protein 1C [Fundidesulfovibrio magnetotacticus]|uniref:peptidoglycan glycosyltransferase n=1 Tax=Fundidesulfovibrio magnetotacticus TaxID=2730080 RepID=A0A6V8LTD2_9BACT|nr:penicillin-binding protein 1C [Fundidesulfovibrio magnetotacticus]GFK92897.1 Penicillin-binding protein 1C [Fundidesulfovibrio magnetotacticus]